MAQGYNYSRGRGGSSSMYRYNEPSIPQYESFFNPIPLEFVQQNLQQHQQKYDVGYGEALAAKDMYAGTEVGVEDIAGKNQLVTDFTKNMDTMVKEKYGGDWGRASKEVARMVTNVRQNPFWDTAKTLKERREQERQLVMKYGPKALQFKSLQGVSAIDPATGQVRKPEELEFDVQEQGDWQGYMKTILSSINPDQYGIGLTDAEKGYLSHGEYSKIDRKKLDKIIDSPEVINAFLNSNPEFGKAVKAGLRYGEYEGNVKEAAKDFFKGNLYPTEFYKESKNYVQDWMLREQMDAAAKTAENPYYASANQSTVIANVDQGIKEHQRKMRGFDPTDKSFDATPWIDPQTGINYNPQAMLDAYDQWTGTATGEQKQKIDQRKQAYYNELVGQHPELRQFKTKEEAFKAYGDWIKNKSEETRLNWNLKLEDSPDNIKRQLFSNINSGNFKAMSFASTGDLFDKNSITDRLGYKDYTELQKAIKDEDISPVVDFREGRIAITIPNKDRKKNVKPETVYFDPDVQTKDVLNVGQYITEKFYDANTYGDNEKPIRIPDGRGGFTGDGIIVQGEGDIVSGNKKKIWLVDLNDTEGKNPPIEISLEDVQSKLTEYVDRSFNNYQGRIGNPGKE